jgi:hypothetical protein
LGQCYGVQARNVGHFYWFAKPAASCLQRALKCTLYG